jgi:hypothetical protein
MPREETHGSSTLSGFEMGEGLRTTAASRPYMLACLLLWLALGAASCGGGRLDVSEDRRYLERLIEDGERLVAAEIDLQANLPSVHDQLAVVLPVVLRNVLFGANNVYDLLTLYEAAEGFPSDRHGEVLGHMHNRMGIILQSNQEDLRLLRDSKEFVLDPNVLLHINYLIEYTRRVNASIAETMMKTGDQPESTSTAFRRP